MKIVLFANTDWYLFNFRLALAQAATQNGHEVLLVSPEGEYGSRLTELGFRWIVAPLQRRSLNPLNELKLILWLRKLLIEEQVDLIHGFTIKCAVYGSLAARTAGSRASVSEIAGLGYVFSSKKWTANILKRLLISGMKIAFGGCRHRTILQNTDDFALFKRLKIVDERCTRLIRGSGVNCARFRCVRHRRINTTLRVLLAARLLWAKGIGDYVEAAKRLRSRPGQIQFILAGNPDPGNPDSVPECQVRKWMEEGLLEWAGHVEDMPALLETIDIFVLPTVYGEGVPRTLIEAAASGCALVATDVPGCREIVINQQTGLLVRPGNLEELVDAIVQLEKSPTMAFELSMAARHKAEQEFDQHIVLAKTQAIYAELCP